MITILISVVILSGIVNPIMMVSSKIMIKFQKHL